MPGVWCPMFEAGTEVLPEGRANLTPLDNLRVVVTRKKCFHVFMCFFVRVFGVSWP